MFAAAGENARHGADVVEIAAIGDDDMFLARLDIVGGIKVHPADAGAKNAEPGMAGVGADEPGLAGRRMRAQITADIARRQAQRTQAGDAQMREILADAAPFFQTSSSGVATVVAVGSNLKSVKMRRVRSATPASSGVPGGKLASA